MNNFAVIGNPITHSLSPEIHQNFASQFGNPLIYKKITGDEALFETQVSDFFKAGGKGLNVTLPFKERAFRMAEVSTTRATRAKAANTLWMHQNRLHADNTDGAGLLTDLQRYVNLADKSLLILGAGGAARGIIEPLMASSLAKLTLTNRNPEKLQLFLQDFPQISIQPFNALTGQYDIIINATSASLKQDPLILPDCLWASHPFCYDLAYNIQSPTTFLVQAQNQGCKAVDGLGMLVEQAAEAFYIWHGVRPQTSAMLHSLKKNPG